MGIGAAIKEIAKEKGMSLKKLAEKAGISYNTLYSITKRDSKRVQSDIIQKLAVALDVSSDYILYVGSKLEFKDGFVILDSKSGSGSWISSEYLREISEPGHKIDHVDMELVAEIIKFLSKKENSEILTAYSKLNEAGREKALERLEELCEIPKYRNKTWDEEIGNM